MALELGHSEELPVEVHQSIEVPVSIKPEDPILLEQDGVVEIPSNIPISQTIGTDSLESSISIQMPSNIPADGVVLIDSIGIREYGSIEEIQDYIIKLERLINLYSNKFQIDSQLNINNIPTTATGLVTGDVWNNSGTLRIV